MPVSQSTLHSNQEGQACALWYHIRAGRSNSVFVVFGWTTKKKGKKRKYNLPLLATTKSPNFGLRTDVHIGVRWADDDIYVTTRTKADPLETQKLQPKPDQIHLSNRHERTIQVDIMISKSNYNLTWPVIKQAQSCCCCCAVQAQVRGTQRPEEIH